MKKNILLILVLILFLAALGWVVFFSPNQKSNLEETNTVNTPTKQRTLEETKSTTTQNQLEKFTPPTTETLTFETGKGTVSVKNFYKNSYLINDVGDAVVFVGGDYQISYIQSDKRFHILVSGENPQEIIKTAEEALLRTLVVNKQDLCKLWVTIHVDRVYNMLGTYPETFGLSFCPN